MQRDVTLEGLYTSRASNSQTVTNLLQDESESVDTHAFVGGMRIRPTDRFSFIFDVEHGTNNNAFVRINPLEFTCFIVRAQFHVNDKLSLNGAFTSLDRLNPTPQVENEADSRSYTAAMTADATESAQLHDVGLSQRDSPGRPIERSVLLACAQGGGEIMENGKSNPLLEKRLRVAGTMVILGLLVELGTLHWSHPTAFLLFLFLGGALMGLGILFYSFIEKIFRRKIFSINL